MDSLNKKFLPHQEWMYYKVYCSILESDIFLLNCIHPLLKDLSSHGLISKWFFIRYSEGGDHLRIRFKLKQLSFSPEVFRLFFDHIDKYARTTHIKKIQIDTYERETSRYGENTINLIETLFCVDSELVLTIIDDIKGDKNKRWLSAVSLIEFYCNGMGLKVKDKEELMKSICLGHRENGFTNQNISKQINQIYRRDSSLVIDYILNYKDKLELSIESELIFKNIFSEIKQSVLMNSDLILENLLSSLIHMSLNRLFRDNANKQEVIIYEYLAKAYKTVQFINV